MRVIMLLNIRILQENYFDSIIKMLLIKNESFQIENYKTVLITCF